MTNKSDTQNTEFKISKKDSKINDLSNKNTTEEISANTTQTNSDDTNLTELLKQGKLKDSTYYIKLNDTLGSEIARLITDQGYPTWQTFGHQIRKDRIKEVLVRVPSYDEMRLIALKVDVISEKIAELAVEKRKMELLLKECSYVLAGSQHIELYYKIKNALGGK